MYLLFKYSSASELATALGSQSAERCEFKLTNSLTEKTFQSFFMEQLGNL